MRFRIISEFVGIAATTRIPFENFDRIRHEKREEILINCKVKLKNVRTKILSHYHTENDWAKKKEKKKRGMNNSIKWLIDKPNSTRRLFSKQLECSRLVCAFLCHNYSRCSYLIRSGHDVNANNLVLAP